MMGRRRDVETVTVLRGHDLAVYGPEATQALWEQVPEPLRLLHYTRRSVPAEYLPSFAFYHRKIGNIHLDALPTDMAHEVGYAIWRTIELGGRITPAGFGLLTRELGETTVRLARMGKPARSLMDRTPQEWEKELAKTWLARTGAVANSETFRTYAACLFRVCKVLWFGYDQGPWWAREIWDPRLDPRIPTRRHEPSLHAVHWHRIEQPWLRAAAMWQAKVALETNRLTWSTVQGRAIQLSAFSEYLARRGVTTPELAANQRDIRPLMLGFLDELRTAPIRKGTIRLGQRRGDQAVTAGMTAVHSLYRFLYDHNDDAARTLGDPRWRNLGPEHSRLFRDHDFPRPRRRRGYDERHLMSDANLAAIAAHLHLLGAPVDQGGLGDEQAMRILLLLIATGRRMSEILLLDQNPLVPVQGDTTEGVVKLRYQQTKIEGAPDTIFVGADVQQIIIEQQHWLSERMRANGEQDVNLPYLFVRLYNNRLGRQPYSGSRFGQQLRRLVDALRPARRDRPAHPAEPNPPVPPHKGHQPDQRRRPLHVVQRYMGHVTPEMTMYYAQTLDATAKAEFLRYQKLTGTGKPAGMTGEDLYELMALETRTDRVLPNGWCSLPPTKTCEKGNACLTCDLFVTDRRFRDVHQSEWVNLGHLIERRQQEHRERTGQDMTAEHVWLKQRHREQAALKNILAAIDAQDESAPPAPLQGPGVAARVEADQRPGRAVG